MGKRAAIWVVFLGIPLFLLLLAGGFWALDNTTWALRVLRYLMFPYFLFWLWYTVRKNAGSTWSAWSIADKIMVVVAVLLSVWTGVIIIHDIMSSLAH